MNLETLTESQLNEIFNADELGTVYSVEDLTPKAKVPQMLHIKVPGTNDLLVRLTHLDTVGTRVKAVVPGDKTVQVFLMSLSDKGNITDFRGGLGSDPVGAINTIFTVIMDIAKKYRFEAVLFRFAKSKMKGQGRAVTRILNRLIAHRSGGRFQPVEEIQRAESKKFDFVLAQKKNTHIFDDVAVPEQFTKVDTKAGETFVDTSTGKQVSKAEVIATAIVSKAEKVTAQQVIAKTKISRKAALAAMYSFNAEQNPIERTPGNEETYQKLMDTTALRPASGPKSGVQSAFNDIDLLGENIIGNIRKTLTSSFKFNRVLADQGDAARESHVDVVTHKIEDILKNADIRDIQSSIVKIAEAMFAPPVNGLQKWQRTAMMGAVIKDLDYIFDTKMSIAYRQGGVDSRSNYTEDEQNAIRGYASTNFEEINGFLLGKRASISSNAADAITSLDKAFEKGNTLEKGTVLYRGMYSNIDLVTNILETKTFYFKNFVSASLRPVFYNTDYGDAVANVDPEAQTVDSGAEYTAQQGNWNVGPRDDGNQDNSKVISPDVNVRESVKISIAMIIRGADKINVIVPGAISPYPNECEVILPRGLMTKITKATTEAKDRDGQGRMMLDMTIVSPEQISEGVVYDGDEFLSTGKLVEMSFSTMYRGGLLEEGQVISDSPEVNDLLLSIMEFDEMPVKFME